VAAVFVGGCQEEPHVMSRLIMQPGQASDLGYSIQWQTRMQLRKDGRLIYVELLGDRLVTLESGNVLTVIGERDGRQIWQTKVAGTLEHLSKPIRLNGSLLICSSSRAYIYDIEEGNLVNVFDLTHASSTTPVVYNGMMIHGSPTGLVFAQDLRLGLERWKYQTSAAISANPVLIDDQLFVTNDAGDLMSFIPASGRIQWRKGAHSKISAKLVHDDRLLYAALYAFNINGGRLNWRHFAEAPMRKTPVRVGDLLLTQVARQGLTLLNPADGASVWTRDDLAGARFLMLVEGKLYYQGAGSIEILDVESGQTIDQVPIPAVHHVVAQSDAGGSLYMIRTNGRIMKLTPL
jgi:outer membrane protein assembly factor BamB